MAVVGTRSDVESKLDAEHHEGDINHESEPILKSDLDTLSIWATVCRFKKVSSLLPFCLAQVRRMTESTTGGARMQSHLYRRCR